MKIYLADKSRIHRDFLKQMRFKCDAVGTDIDVEKIIAKYERPGDAIGEIAKARAKEAEKILRPGIEEEYAKLKERQLEQEMQEAPKKKIPATQNYLPLIVGCETIVTIHREIVTKSENKTEALETLKKIASNPVMVYSSLYAIEYLENIARKELKKEYHEDFFTQQLRFGSLTSERIQERLEEREIEQFHEGFDPRADFMNEFCAFNRGEALPCGFPMTFFNNLVDLHAAKLKEIALRKQILEERLKEK